MKSQQRRGELGPSWLLLGGSLLVFVLLGLLLWSPWEQRGITGGQQLVFYCAAGMSEPVQDIIDQYQKEYGVTVQPSFEGSGQLLAKMKTTRGAQVDLFLSADEFHMEKAQQLGLVAESIPVAYLQPVLVVSRQTQQDLQKEGKPVSSLQDLLRSDLRVMLADPALAAVGKLTKEILSRPEIDIWSTLSQQLKDSSPRVSTVGTVNEVATHVRTVRRAVGIVWKATAQQWRELEIVDVPALPAAKKEIRIGVLAHLSGKDATAALQFARFLSARDRGLAIFTRHGFDVVPDADIWAAHPEVHISAGSMLRPGVEDVLADFEKREGITIKTTYAGCGILVSQMKTIKKGQSPHLFPDAYISCDTSYLNLVRPWFEEDSITTLASNDLVLIVPKGNPKNIQTLTDLLRPDIKKIGLGHPTNCAMGKLTDDLLKKVGIHEQLYSGDGGGRVIHSDAGHELVNKLEALDVAIAYRSNVLTNPRNLERMDIVDIAHPDAHATQPFAIARTSQHKYLMRRLLRAIVAHNSADRFRSLGFHWLYSNE